MDNIIGIGLMHFQTRADAFKFERAAAKGLADDACLRKFQLVIGVSYLQATLEDLLSNGVAKDAIAEALAGMIDAISDADHACNRDIDAAGEHFDSLDLSEARAMLDGLRGP